VHRVADCVDDRVGLAIAEPTEWQHIANQINTAMIFARELTKSAKPGWSLGCVSPLDLEGRTIWIVDAHGYGKRFIVRADEKLTAFVELEREIHAFAVSLVL
jgi:hypothetical protein